ncbi:hypothetical protein P4S73_25290 [Paraglaciecola sp. Hal342]
MVSYQERHNEANGEQNRDGHGHNLSANYGVEGPTTDTDIIAMREQQKRNLFTTLLLSQGIPHVLGGDELSRTQQGNNNAYCQDNPISWLDWNLDENKRQFLAFCQHVINIRKESVLLHHLQLRDDNFDLSHNVAKFIGTALTGHENSKMIGMTLITNALPLSYGVKNMKPVKPLNIGLLYLMPATMTCGFNCPTYVPNQRWKLTLDTRYADLRKQPEVVVQNCYKQAK